MNYNLKIKEFKEIAELIRTNYSFDIGNFTYVSLKIKVEQFCINKDINSVNITLIEKLKTNRNLLEELVTYIFINEFELFRDPALWRALKEDVLSTFTRDIQYRVWIPSCFDGSDLLSFLILREELQLTNRIKVEYTTPLKILNRAKEGFLFEERKHNLNLSNYKRIDGQNLPDKYFKRNGNLLIPSKELFKNTIYNEFCEIQNGLNIKNANLIIYRNKLLNYNRKLQVNIINNLINSTKTGGFITLGVKEVLVDDVNREKFIIFNIKESLYKKR